MLILGINAYHGDSAACLLRSGDLIAAAEEERFRRVKHWAGLPTEAIRYCLREAGIGLGAVDLIAINRNPRANSLRRLVFLLARRPDIGLLLNRARRLRTALSVSDSLQQAFPSESLKAKVRYVEHHRAHLASAFFVSPFAQAACLSIDGFGDYSSTAWGIGEGNGIRIDGRVCFPHSLGVFYSALTQYLGFRQYGDEYKVMGLAAYGTPRYLNAMRQIVLARRDGIFRLDVRFFLHSREKFVFNWSNCAPEVGTLYAPELLELLGPARSPEDSLEERHRDIASSVQVAYEEAFFALLNTVHEKYKSPHLALAGGCALNSVANGKIYARTPFTKVYMPPAAGDAGGAIGAAYAAWHELRPSAPRFQMEHAYWGPRDETVAGLLTQRAGELSAERCTVRQVCDTTALCATTAEAVSQGRVVGWFQGRMEFGPRALGNRSILADPRRADMKRILNEKIKRRESFRPFAPSILREAVPDWFEVEDDVPFMMQVFRIRPEKRRQIPAVTHVDGSGRLQTVHGDSNPLYHRLISEFNRLTSVPMVLNTSFNENEPIVCRAEEALECFLRTRMDVLILENYAIERRD